MPGRHIAPRHRSPQSRRRKLGRLAGDVAGLVPSSGLARTAVAVGAAGIAVGVGAVTVDVAPVASAAGTSHSPHSGVAQEAGSLLEGHADPAANRVSRSVARPPLLRVQRAIKAASLPPSRQALGGAMTKSVAPATPRELAMMLLQQSGWDSGQYSCLDALWTRESNWNPYAQNSSSGAYGIPQALPGSKMASFGSDWATNPQTQIKWGLSYISLSYGSPCGAWYHSESYGWY